MTLSCCESPFERVEMFGTPNICRRRSTRIYRESSIDRPENCRAVILLTNSFLWRIWWQIFASFLRSRTFHRPKPLKTLTTYKSVLHLRFCRLDRISSNPCVTSLVHPSFIIASAAVRVEHFLNFLTIRLQTFYCNFWSGVFGTRMRRQRFVSFFTTPILWFWTMVIRQGSSCVMP